MKIANLFYFQYINKIGGIETWYYQLAKNPNINKYDVAIAYMSADETQLKRLSKYVKLIQWKQGDVLECQNLFVNFNTEIAQYVKYDKLIFFAHGDYLDMVNRGQLSRAIVNNLAKSVESADRYGVSQIVCDRWKELTGQDMKVCYNPLELDEPKKIVRLISAQRMTREKGLERIKALVRELNRYSRNNDVLWEWDIFTDDTDKIDNLNVKYRVPTLDITSYLPRYDWFVILSDNEGYCYGAVESLMAGVPIIKTPCPVFDEIGINDSNSVTLNFDCSNVASVVEKIYNTKPTFTYKPKKSNITDLLVKKLSDYKEKINKPVKVVATSLFDRLGVMDSELGYVPKENEEWETNYLRAEMLRNRGYVK